MKYDLKYTCKVYSFSTRCLKANFIHHGLTSDTLLSQTAQNADFAILKRHQHALGELICSVKTKISSSVSQVVCEFIRKLVTCGKIGMVIGGLLAANGAGHYLLCLDFDNSLLFRNESQQVGWVSMQKQTKYKREKSKMIKISSLFVCLFD